MIFLHLVNLNTYIKEVLGIVLSCMKYLKFKFIRVIKLHSYKFNKILLSEGLKSLYNNLMASNLFNEI